MWCLLVLGYLGMIVMSFGFTGASNSTLTTPRGKYPLIYQGRLAFETDSRLDKRITLPDSAPPNGILLKRLKTSTGVEVSIVDRDTQAGRTFLFASNPSARSVMDALARLHDGRWERTLQNGYRLLNSLAVLDFVFRPYTETERQRQQFGAEMLSAIDRLPEKQRNAILRPDSPLGASIADLPDPIQDLIKKMVGTLNEEDAASGSAPLTEESLNASTISIIDKGINEHGIHRRFVTIRNERETTGWRLNDYEQVRERQLNAGKAIGGSKESIYSPSEVGPSQEQIRNAKVMQQRVSFRGKAVRLRHIVASLHAQTSVPFMTGDFANNVAPINIEFENIPLAEALDRVIKKYPGVEWNKCKYDFVVVRKVQTFSRKQGEATNAPPSKP